MAKSVSPLIAVDFDDVLVATNDAAARWHNDHYGTSLTVDDFLYYHWWKNPYWGNMKDTFDKVLRFYQSEEYLDAPPLQEAYRTCKRLKTLGFRLVVVTARSEEHRQITQDAITRYFPGIFDSIEFTASISSREGTHLTKSQLLEQLGAILLIDDSLDNCIDCAEAGIPVILFGDYEWNKRISPLDSERDSMGFSQRESIEGKGTRWWTKDDRLETSLSPLIRRVDGWEDVLAAVKEHVSSH